MSEIIETFNSLLQLAVENGASDIHIKSDKPAYLRLHGGLMPIEMDPLSADMVYDFLENVCPDQFLDRWHEDNQIDFSYSIEGIGRFRVNGFFQRGTPSIVFRHVKDQPPTFEDLNLLADELIGFRRVLFPCWIGA